MSKIKSLKIANNEISAEFENPCIIKGRNGSEILEITPTFSWFRVTKKIIVFNLHIFGDLLNEICHQLGISPSL